MRRVGRLQWCRHSLTNVAHKAFLLKRKRLEDRMLFVR
jgi:hypothetical protein